jgi:hypothetical protein
MTGNIFPLRGSTSFDADVTSPPGARAAALWVDDGDWDETDIPRRGWIAPGYVMRKAVTLIGGQGSAGKSSLCVGWAVALATGQALGRFQPVRRHGVAAQECARYRVSLYNVEDDNDEQKRRLTAALRVAGYGPDALRGRVARLGPHNIGTLLELDPATGRLRETPVWERLVEHIEAFRPDVLCLDPLVELHTADENSNGELRHVIARLRGLAQQYDLAVLLVHHTRKGSVAGDMDSLRGAGSIVGAARMVFTVATMTAEEAQKLGVSAVARRSFFRVDGAKANYAPASDASWHELSEYRVDNGVADDAGMRGEDGDRVAAAKAWTPPEAARADDSPELMARIEAAIERGVGGEPYATHISEDLQKHPRSLWPVLVGLGITDRKVQRDVVKALLRDRGVEAAQYVNAKGNKPVGLRAKSGRPAVRWVEGEG